MSKQIQQNQQTVIIQDLLIQNLLGVLNRYEKKQILCLMFLEIFIVEIILMIIYHH
jgi:hypothetical protein